MNKFNYYATMIVASFVVGYGIPKFGFNVYANITLCAVAGVIIGLVWRHFIGYNEPEGEE